MATFKIKLPVSLAIKKFFNFDSLFKDFLENLCILDPKGRVKADEFAEKFCTFYSAKILEGAGFELKRNKFYVLFDSFIKRNSTYGIKEVNPSGVKCYHGVRNSSLIDPRIKIRELSTKNRKLSEKENLREILHDDPIEWLSKQISPENVHNWFGIILNDDRMSSDDKTRYFASCKEILSD